MRRYTIRLSNILYISCQKTPNPKLQNIWILSLISLKIPKSCPIVIIIYKDNYYYKGGNNYNKDGNYYHGCDNYYLDP